MLIAVSGVHLSANRTSSHIRMAPTGCGFGQLNSRSELIPSAYRRASRSIAAAPLKARRLAELVSRGVPLHAHRQNSDVVARPAFSEYRCEDCRRRIARVTMLPSRSDQQ